MSLKDSTLESLAEWDAVPDVCYRFETDTREFYLRDFDDESVARVGNLSLFLSLYVYRIVRRTPKGYWYTDFGKERYVCNNWRKRSTHLTIKEALDAAIIRKQRATAWAEWRLMKAKASIQQLERLRDGVAVEVSTWGRTPQTFTDPRYLSAY